MPAVERPRRSPSNVSDVAARSDQRERAREGTLAAGPRLVGVLPAAGRGVRAYPYTETIPKAMLEVDGVPVLQRNVELMRDQLDIRDVWIVVGHRGEVIRDRLGNGSALGMQLRYITNPRIDLELPYSLYLAAREIDRFCCVILADECYVGSNHRELLATPYVDALATCGLIASEHPKYTRKNYTVALQDGRIVGLEEKPHAPIGAVMGTGTYLLHPDLLARLRAAFEPDPERGPRDWTSWLGQLCSGGGVLRPFVLRGGYVNINSRDDLNRANCLMRALTAAEKRRSLVFIVNQDNGAAASVAKFAQSDDIHEIVVASNRPLPGVVTGGKLRAVTAPQPAAQVGELVRLGLTAARGDILVLVDSDETFSPRDISKFLVYLQDADMVVGTRTTRQMLEQATNMRGIVRAAHVILAKLLELLWWQFDPRLTDTCCVYRAFWRSTYDAIRPNLASADAAIYAEMVIEVMRARRRMIEIPVNYYNPDPTVPAVRTRYQNVNAFLRIALMMIRKRLQHSGAVAWLRGRLRAPAAE
jgi:NDP-sugar pyrophosphorylase family protein